MSITKEDPFVPNGKGLKDAIHSWYCKDGLAFRLGSKRNDRIGAPVGHALTPHFFFCHFVLPLASLSTRPLVQDNCKQITSSPTLTASHHPFLILFVFLFLCTLGNDDRPLAAAARHQYAPEHSSIDFSSFLLTFLLLFPCTFSTTTTRLPTHPRHRSVYHQIRLQSVGTHMYLSKPPR